MKELVEKLENSLMELGTEVHVLRSQVAKANEENDRIVRIMETIQRVLDEKNIISQEDIEIALKMEGDDLVRSDREEFEVLMNHDEAKKYTH